MLRKFPICGTFGCMYIHRELQDRLLLELTEKDPAGFIVSGIVGSGKTTMIENLLKALKTKFEVFVFDGDDSSFRQKVLTDTKFLFDEVSSKTTGKALIFVDEVQKCEEIFDAIKYAFDKGRYSFIVSGSNPAYLATVAKKRLQRRAELLYFLPINLRELYCDQSGVKNTFEFEKILWTYTQLAEVHIPKMTVNSEFIRIQKDFFLGGGLPLAFLASGLQKKLKEIRLTVERGFELMSHDNNAISEFTRLEIAKLHGLEFTYKNILEKVRIRKRDPINRVIDELTNHGYLVKRKPLLLQTHRTSYLSIFSYVDPGIVTYLSGDYSIEKKMGSLLEGYVHSRLQVAVMNSSFKSELGYYKPFIIESGDKIKYKKGEIDFVLTNGPRIIPIECKYAENSSNIDTSVLSEFIKSHHCPYGVILYGGVPKLIKEKKIIFWPYWFV